MAMSTTLQRGRNRLTQGRVLVMKRHSYRAMDLLKAIGVCEATVYNYGTSNRWPTKSKRKTLWKRSELEIMDLLHRAHDCYVSAMLQLRADLGHEHERAVVVNDLWHRIQVVFRKRGYEL